MIQICSGVFLILFVVVVFLTGRQDWTEDVSDISPFWEEVEMARTVQTFTKYVMYILSTILIALGLGMIVQGFV